MSHGPNTALLIIDVQRGVMATCFDREGVLSRIGTLISRARSAGVPVVFIQHEEPQMQRHSSEWQLEEDLDFRPGDLVVNKTYRDAFADTTLLAELEGLDAGRLVIAGAQSDYCVRSTAHRAAIEGFTFTLVSDAHTTEDLVFEGVAVSAPQIIAHTNQYFSHLRYPGLKFGIATHDQVLLP